MSTKSCTVFVRDLKDGTSEAFGALYCRDDGGPDMLFGSQLSSLLCLRGRAAKSPDNALETAFSSRRCGSWMDAPDSAGEESLNVMRTLKELRPYGGIASEPAGFLADAFAPGAGTPEDRTAACVQKHGTLGLGELNWVYAVRWKETKLGMPDEGPSIQAFDVWDGCRESFRGTPEDFRREFGRGAPQSLHELWTEAASYGVPLGSVPAREVSRDLCLAAVEGNPMNIADVPAEFLSPELCRVCGENFLEPGNAVLDGMEQDAAQAVGGLLERRGASAEARAAFSDAFKAALAKKLEEEDEGPRP